MPRTPTLRYVQRIQVGVRLRTSGGLGRVDRRQPFPYITPLNRCLTSYLRANKRLSAGEKGYGGVSMLDHDSSGEGGDMKTALRQELQAHLLDYSLRFGDFTLTSGRKSDYYIDGKQTTLRSRGAYLVARLILDELKNAAVDAIGGPTLGADPVIGAVVALAALEDISLVGFIVRKEPKRHGTQRWIEGPLQPGMRVAVFDDTVTTGGSLKHAIDQVEAAQCTVVKVLVIVDRQEGAGQHFARWGYPLQALFTIDELKAARTS